MPAGPFDSKITLQKVDSKTKEVQTMRVHPVDARDHLKNGWTVLSSPSQVTAPSEAATEEPKPAAKKADVKGDASVGVPSAAAPEDTATDADETKKPSAQKSKK